MRGRDEDRQAELEARRANLHIRRNLFFERIVPILLVVLGIVTLALILIALGVLLGITPWR
jgi:hypothetical protein